MSVQPVDTRSGHMILLCGSSSRTSCKVFVRSYRTRSSAPIISIPLWWISRLAHAAKMRISAQPVRTADGEGRGAGGIMEAFHSLCLITHATSNHSERRRGPPMTLAIRHDPVSHREAFDIHQTSARVSHRRCALSLHLRLHKSNLNASTIIGRRQLSNSGLAKMNFNSVYRNIFEFGRRFYKGPVGAIKFRKIEIHFCRRF